MKPIKPKKMPKRLEQALATLVRERSTDELSHRQARSILAALEYERQRWQESQEKLADRNLGLMALARKHGWTDVEKEIASARWPNLEAKGLLLEVRGYDVVTPEQQRAETEAVIPKPRKKLTAP